ncbi:unnamed protein product [Haemonchus placei]|uniref:REJ domain-containing protein n=1 Tax=Haemonchus placei TaxID=6290 RepID=A0A0N4WEV8_HAEPC|nr:unnamed protein product [Haemonchus placei]
MSTSLSSSRTSTPSFSTTILVTSDRKSPLSCSNSDSPFAF